MSKHHRQPENIYSSAIVQALEQQYCSSCSAAVVSSCCLVSSHGLGARVMSRIYNGGRRAIYTATVGAMLANNLALPAYGETYSDQTVTAGQTSTVLAGDTWIGTNVSAPYNYSGVAVLNVSGNTISTELTGRYGCEMLYDGGVAESTTIFGGSQVIYSGGIANNAILSGGSQLISDGGIASSSIVNSYGQPWVSSGGVAIGGTVNSLGFQVISDGGLATDTVINYSGHQIISSGGVAVNAILSSGRQSVFDGGMASNTIFASHGTQDVSGGIAYDITVGSYGAQCVSSGGVASKVTVNENGRQFIGKEGVVSDTTVNSGGSQYMSWGGIASDTTINSGYQYISDGGIASDTTINGGYQYIYFSGVASDTTINSGGNQIIDWYGIASDTTVNFGGSQIISEGGVASDTRVVSYGKQYINVGGIASDTEIDSGGHQYISEGGEARGTVIGQGWQSISSGGIASDTTVNSDGSQTISSGGIADGATINSGGEQIVYGMANGTIVQSSGWQYVAESGVASDAIVNEGGFQDVYDGGVALNTTVNLDGYEEVFDGGIASGTTINSGGNQTIDLDGIASDTIVNSGGRQYIYEGGVAEGTVVSGGTVNLFEGGIINGCVGEGGEINVYGNGNMTGNISLADATFVHMKDGSAGQRLTMENLSASGAAFNMNVDLKQQTGDQINITGRYEGNATLRLTNVADSAKGTSGDGIKLVEFSEGSEVDGTFDLAGGQWDEGGYVYKLEQGTEGGAGYDYYLRNTGDVTDTFKTMLNIPVINVVVGQTGMNSLQRRLGDLRAMNNAEAKQGVWVRSYYKDMTVEDLVTTDLNLFGAEVGYDWLFREDEPTKLYAGVLVGFVATSGIRTENNKGNYDTGRGEAPGVGVYATLVNENGWFVDLAARNFWTKLDMKSHLADGRTLVYKPNRNILTGSIEAGKNFERELSRNRFIRIEPKLELSGTNAEGTDTGVRGTDYKIKYYSANYGSVKAGVLLSYNAKRDNGLLIEPLLELAYRYDFVGKNRLAYGGAEAESDLRGNAAEINAGLNMQLTENLYWYGLGSYEAGEKVKGWGVHAGIRYAFGREGGASTPQIKTKAMTNNKTATEKTAQQETTSYKAVQTRQSPQPQRVTPVETMQLQQDQKDLSFMKKLEQQWREGK